MKRRGMSEIHLTDREQKVLEFIRQYRNEHGYAPAMREIAEGTGIRSTSMISFYLANLKKAGLITYEPCVARSIVLVDQERIEHGNRMV
jgi:repressor LexA